MSPVFALYAWPVVVAVLFKQLKTPLAVLVALVAGYLLLPELVQIKTNIDILPALTKNTIPAIATALLAFAITFRKASDFGRPGWVPQNWIARILLLVLFFSAFMTVISNGDPLVYGPRFLQGMKLYDYYSSTLNLMVVLLPFLLARKFLAGPEAHKLLLLTLCIAGLLYSLLALYEVRMSPQLNRMVYGFFPHSWVQHIRGAGFRPIVFLQHGLWLAIFLSGTIFAALGLFRITRGPRRWLFLGAAFWLLLTLVLAKSLGALIITLLLIPVVILLGIRLQLLVAAIIAVLVLSYPLVRGAGLVPVDAILSVAQDINPQRASSLNTRFNNEDALLAKAQQRKLFGWGGYGRARIYDENGRSRTIQDGYWAIIIGLGGWVRYLTEFGLLTAPMILLFLRRRKYEIGMETAALTVIVAGGMLDLLVNASITPLSWMVVGALWGRLELQSAGEIMAEEAPRQRRSDKRRYRSSDIADKTPDERIETDAAENRPSIYTRQRNRLYRKEKSGD